MGVRWFTAHMPAGSDERGFFGLRLINNNIVSDGSGKDFTIFGCAGYRNGRLTPKPKDEGRLCVYHPPPKINRAKVPKRMPPHHGSTGSLPTFDGSKGPSISLRPEVQRRWERTHAAGCGIDPGPRRSPSAPEFPAKRRPLPGDPDLEREEAAFNKAVEDKMFRLPTFPVPKYRTFSQRECYTATDGRGEEHAEPEESPPKLGPAPVEKYLYFSGAAINRSPHFEPERYDHGLSMSKKTFQHKF